MKYTLKQSAACFRTVDRAVDPHDPSSHLPAASPRHGAPGSELFNECYDILVEDWLACCEARGIVSAWR